MRSPTDLNLLKNKVCLVTGGTRGIGRAIVEMLVEENAAVAICGRQQEAVDRTLEELRAHGADKVKGRVADVRSYEDVRSLFEFVDAEFGGLDVLVNNAGVGVFAPVWELALDEWQRVLETNLQGVFHCSREALFRFEVRGGGDIVTISSLAGKNPFAGGAAYNASKFALTGFSEAMMLDARSRGVRVSYIMPGSVATEFGGKDSDSGSDWKIWPEDVADIVRMVVLMPKRTMVSRVEVRPSRPKR